MSSGPHLDVTASRPRPRPPGARRISNTNQRIDHDDIDVGQPSSSSSQPSSSTAGPPSPRKAIPKIASHSHLDLDLDLDLPSHLTAALQESARVGHSGGQGHERRSTAGTASSPSPEMIAALWERARSPGLSQADPFAAVASLGAASQQGSDLAEAAAPGGEVLDQEWVGGLAREELEAMLFHASSVIRDRERDLGIAAAIGQALLQKNISLRGRHEKVMNELDSSMAYDEDDEDMDDVAENFTPPTNDTVGEDETPFATERSGYFGTSSPVKALRPTYTPSPAKQRPPLSQVVFNAGPNTNGLIHSPSATSLADSQLSSTSGYRSASQRGGRASTPYGMQTSETQKQLSLLSTQNEKLLGQLTELQDEAEDAKREGGKKLRKLNKEIEVLQMELEAATQRNSELEQENNAASGDRARASPDKARKSWAFSQPASPSISRRSTSLSLSTSISGGIDALLSKTGGHDFDDAQRALVVRLLDKMKELEATNKVLEGEKKERESRLGAALEKGVRISDEYDAVLHAHESTWSLRDHFSGDTSRGGSQLSSAVNSPQRHTQQSKRAIGNRVQVEGRKTVRTAMRYHDGEGIEVAGITPSSTLSSLASSSSSLSSLAAGRKPRRKRSALALNRPRILITPSMEDLATRRREQAEGWEDENVARSAQGAAPDAGEPGASSKDETADMLMRRTRENSLDPSDANKIAWQMRRSSLESIDDNAPRTPAKQRRASPPSAAASPASAAATSDGAYDRYMAHFSSTPVKDDNAQPMTTPSASPWQRRPSSRFYRRNSDASLHQSQEEGGRCHQQTLGSELGSVFGDQRTLDGGDDTLRVNETPASGRHLRAVTSFESLRAPSEAMSDIAHLRWSSYGGKELGGQSSSNHTIDAGGYEGAASSPLRLTGADSSRQLVHRRTTPHLSSSLEGEEADDSLWSTSLSHPLISPGSLRDRHQEPGEEQYTLLGQMSKDQPVMWADDEDYGVPLKESEARRLGLAPRRKALPASMTSGGGSGVRRMLRGRTSTAALGLLNWVTGAGTRATTTDSRPSAAIQSAEQLREEREREEMLREKYHIARQRRIGHRAQEELHEEDDDWEVQERSMALASAGALTTPQRRKAWYNRPRPMGSPAKGVRYEQTLVDSQPGPDLPSPPSPTQPNLPTSSSALTLRSVPSAPVRRGRRSTASAAVEEVTAWVSLVFVLILAFFVSASRGPKRILGGEEEQEWRGKQRAERRDQEDMRYIQYRNKQQGMERDEEGSEGRSPRSALAGARRRGQRGAPEDAASRTSR